MLQHHQQQQQHDDESHYSGHVDPADEFGALLAQPEPSFLSDDGAADAEDGGLNSTAGLRRQEAAAKARHGGDLEEYLRALAQPGQGNNTAARRAALAKLSSAGAAQHGNAGLIYASPLRTHSAAAYQQRERESRIDNFRADPIVRGSHASSSAAVPTPQHRQSATAALTQIMYTHQVGANVMH
jgi:hypothetical protein